MTASEQFCPLNVAVLTVSNRRTAADDTSGDLIRQRLTAAQHRVVASRIAHGDAADMRKLLKSWFDDPEIDAIVSTGGTGVMDQMPEAAGPLLEREVPGFAQMFQTLSYQDIGSSGMLSRAMAGIGGQTLLFLLPGSVDGCRLALDHLVLPQLDSRTRPCALAGLLSRVSG